MHCRYDGGLGRRAGYPDCRDRSKPGWMCSLLAHFFSAWQRSGWGGRSGAVAALEVRFSRGSASRKKQLQPTDLSIYPSIAPLLEYYYNTVAVGEREPFISIFPPSRLQNYCCSLMVCRHHYHHRRQEQKQPAIQDGFCSIPEVSGADHYRKPKRW